MSRTNKSRWLIGAAIAISLAKVLSQSLPSKRNRTGWKEQAQDTVGDMWEELQEWREGHRHIPHVHFLLGSLAGSVVGVATALLTAPKAGKELIHDLSEAIQPHKSSHLKPVEKKVSTRRKGTVRQVSATKRTQRKKETHVTPHHSSTEGKHVSSNSSRSGSASRKKKETTHHHHP